MTRVRVALHVLRGRPVIYRAQFRSSVVIDELGRNYLIVDSQFYARPEPSQRFVARLRRAIAELRGRNRSHSAGLVVV